jgi:hypothetical protein
MGQVECGIGPSPPPPIPHLGNFAHRYSIASTDLFDQALPKNVMYSFDFSAGNSSKSKGYGATQVMLGMLREEEYLGRQDCWT